MPRDAQWRHLRGAEGAIAPPKFEKVCYVFFFRNFVSSPPLKSPNYLINFSPPGKMMK